ncbi:MAG: NUDIX domain-containing protein [Methylicorpusculum sp.]|uniref:NUDIX hydrolase n=1 Tax=Methylicorpusculum sp. TaxID=2713644 RepID=UPI00271CC2A4|nr:NUDIX domain-containing protein [Methylicorpusculum sp.]MDO8939008.1 NUDIX domain-containing protein [Methylicorpusculum sp.]MDO9238596.1 NUDIX domain-containing protein [Methylicorpusculum sp.]MDP2201830.1 NUDIX domain-containing protein [Methylicorpusculum sp.]
MIIPINNPPIPAIGVSGIVFNAQHNVLLIKRNQPPALGLWSIPGGKLEAGETLVEACRREVKEETGMDVRVVSMVAVVERRIDQFHYVIVDFLAELEEACSSIPVAQTDVSEARWVSMQQLDDFELVPGLQEIMVRTYDAYCRGEFPGFCDASSVGSDFILPAAGGF